MVGKVLSERAAAAKIFTSLFAAMLATSILAGCTASGMDWTTIKSKADLEGAAPITRLLILANMVHEGFSPGMYDGFEAGMTSMLTTCGLTSKMLHKVDELVMRENIDRIMQEFRPDAVFLIRSAGGTILHYRREFLDHNNLFFDLEIIDADSNKTTWQAKAELQLTRNVRYDDKRSGSEFATHIIWRLRGDGLLNGCPVGKLPRPKGRRISA